jgi:hypothetical protein
MERHPPSLSTRAHSTTSRGLPDLGALSWRQGRFGGFPEVRALFDVPGVPACLLGSGGLLDSMQCPVGARC